ncbi:hypothetical protein LM602_03415 [Candidatus Acetothermia bacterium]|nr:hypothetical protein [Candidatus Acetothermia bacterium]MCI2431590.1 hypothetical protein [Candidatus Acetothermia bacterium]MCI2436772.1 hypothetical protein [Candidatus Acetothermia bacterium]
MSRIHGVIGPTARGVEFWDREREIGQIWKALETSSILLTAPRRFGKTSLMLRLMDQPQDGWWAFFFEVEAVDRPEAFITEIIRTLLRDQRLDRWARQSKKFFGKLANRIEEIELAGTRVSLREQPAPHWQETGRELIERLRGLETKIILIIDEFPLMLERIHKKDNLAAHELLSWLRSLRQNPDLHEKIRWVMGGSIGIEHVLRRIGAGIKEINDLERIHVREFSQDSAREFIQALLRSAGVQRISREILDKFLEVIDIPIPYFIQILVCESLNEMKLQNKRTLSKEMIEQAYENGLLDLYGRRYFEHYYKRLRDYYDPEMADTAKALLTEIARRGSLTKRELWTKFQAHMKGQGDADTFSHLLSDLENDFYLVGDHGRQRFRFATKVLRDWWLRHHAL